MVGFLLGIISCLEVALWQINVVCVVVMGELVDYLLLHCPVTYTLWTFTLQAFGIHWVMPGLVARLLFCWHQWLWNHTSNIWNLIPGCLMWIAWLERKCHSFEDTEKT